MNWLARNWLQLTSSSIAEWVCYAVLKIRVWIFDLFIEMRILRLLAFEPSKFSGESQLRILSKIRDLFRSMICINVLFDSAYIERKSNAFELNFRTVHEITGALCQSLQMIQFVHFVVSITSWMHKFVTAMWQIANSLGFE